MEHRPLGRCGLKVTPLTLGAMTFGQSQGFMKGVTSPDDVSRRVLDRALEAGINCIDTANVYSEGHSERLLGGWLQGRRHAVVLATKCRFVVGDPRLAGPHDQGLSRRHIIQACEESLRRLQTDYIDLYQVHMQDTSVPVEETLRALDDLVSQGKVRYAGCSNYTGYRLVESLWTSDRRDLVRYESVQLQYSLICRDAEREVIPACKAHGLGVLAWSPLGRGFLSGKYARDSAPPSGSRLEAWKDTWRMVATERNFQVLDAVLDVAREAGTTPSAVSLAWALAKPFMSSIIIGARDEKQLDENLAALNVRLTPAQQQLLDDASKPAWGYPYDFIGARQEW
jgi:aryl-alcohol dehydrogenase-like predicted oxidoreductase